MSATPLPSLASLLKSKEVEDLVNLYLHRPLAYLFVRAFYRTSLTPNGVTLLATTVGVVAGACWWIGNPTAMVLGGILLWTSAILDGADGILARAKNLQSQFGRALDGTSDLFVAAVTVTAAAGHMWLQQRDTDILWLSLVATVTAVLHLNLYDFYKESFLRMTRPERGEGEDVEQIEERVRNLHRSNSTWLERFAMARVFLPYMRQQQRLIQFTNPIAGREGVQFRCSEQTAAIYRRHNTGPMRLWALVSLAPHSYLMAIFGMLDRLDVYLWIRLLVMNGLCAVALLWQRRASERTQQQCLTSAAPRFTAAGAAISPRQNAADPSLAG